MQWPGIKSRKALITGASSGLGAHFARLLAEQGAVCTLAARRVDKLESLAAEISAAGGQVDTLTLDVSDPDGVEQALDGRVFDIVVNNAGVTATAKALDHDAATFSHVIDTNLNGAFGVARQCARAMVEAGQGGTIINVASILGVRVAGMVAAYAASKAGLIQASRTMAQEWARHGIRVNALCPGYIETELNRDFFATDAGRALIKRVPQRRLGQPSDLDGPLLLLASDLGAFMTGTEVVADGGHLVTSI
ncbi:MAG: 2-deoxy-D-gluconate 3-dehydrogenase [Rhodobacteraceae bacterium]|nr:2-deoxy-D-gluconate 3-dehydrogenase [Paracoccaceae bacterium]